MTTTMTTMNNMFTFYPTNPAVGGGYTVRKREPVRKHTTPNKTVLVDPKTREIHTWNRRAYSTWTLAKDENCCDAHTRESSIQSGRRFINSMRKLVCPIELMNNGVCPSRFEPEHHECFYHFTKMVNGKVEQNDGKPVCRYSLTDKKNLCWEGTNSEHHKVFHHDD
jgi:hypothetical protein